MTTNMIDTFKSRITEGGGLAMGNLYRVFDQLLVFKHKIWIFFVNLLKYQDKYYQQKDLWV